MVASPSKQKTERSSAYDVLKKSMTSVEERVAKLLSIKRRENPKSQLRELVPQTFVHFVTFSQVPKGLEMGIGTKLRREKALIFVTSQYLTHSPLLPEVGVDEVHFEVELVHFIQNYFVLSVISTSTLLLPSQKLKQEPCVFGRCELWEPIVRDVLGDGRLVLVRSTECEFLVDCPLQDSRLHVHYKGMVLDDVFYDTRVRRACNFLI
ncbi:hypothetical protein Dimus_023062 [Dionaea muscipula]